MGDPHFNLTTGNNYNTTTGLLSTSYHYLLSFPCPLWELKEQVPCVELAPSVTHELLLW